MSATIVEEKEKVKREVRLSIGMVERIKTELKSLGFGMPSEHEWYPESGFDDRRIEELVTRIAEIAPLQLQEMLERGR